MAMEKDRGISVSRPPIVVDFVEQGHELTVFNLVEHARPLGLFRRYLRTLTAGTQP